LLLREVSLDVLDFVAGMLWDQSHHSEFLPSLEIIRELFAGKHI
jgi:hypothetical protein